MNTIITDAAEKTISGGHLILQAALSAARAHPVAAGAIGITAAILAIDPKARAKAGWVVSTVATGITSRAKAIYVVARDPSKLPMNLKEDITVPAEAEA